MIVFPEQAKGRQGIEEKLRCSRLRLYGGGDADSIQLSVFEKVKESEAYCHLYDARLGVA